MSPLYVVVLFNTAQLALSGHAASPGKTLHVEFFEGDWVEKTKWGEYSVGRLCKSEFCSCIISYENRFAAFSTSTKSAANIK